MTVHDFTGAAGLLFEIGLLKHSRRTGWWIAGIKDPETIAEHSFRVAIIASLLASLEGADPGRASLLAIYHDAQETRVSDIPHIGRRYVTAASNEAVTADQVATCPEPVAHMVRRAVEEYEAGTCAEAVVAIPRWM